MADKYGFSWCENSDGCCGVAEIQGFQEYDQREARPWLTAEDYDVSAPTEKELWVKVFEEMLNDQRDEAFCHIWFVRNAGDRRFEQSGLMQLFENSKHCKKLGTARNPNTGNTIRGYLFRSFTRYGR